jgi:SAM-dependent methyltransferase
MPEPAPVAPRRLAFGRVAELYEQTRPGYPPTLVRRVLEYSGLTPADRVLEIGAGTGKATRLFATAGHALLALEPSAEMAAVARRACAGLPSVTIVEIDFEHWPLDASAFRLIFSAQAWHWIDPAIRYAKAREALNAGGTLAAFWNRPDWSRCALRATLQEAYGRTLSGPMASGPMQPSVATGELLPAWEREVEGASGFAEAEVHRYPWECRYGAEEYVSLLATHSDHMLLDAATRELLFKRITEAIADHGGTFAMTYVAQLCLARAL